MSFKMYNIIELALLPSNVDWVVRKLLSVLSYILTLSPRRKLGSQGAAQSSTDGQCEK